jgi:superfamily II DNA or RNA helicase
MNRISDALEHFSGEAVPLAAEALRALPSDPVILLLAALTELAAGQPDRALTLLKRFRKRYEPGPASALLAALALGQQKRFSQAQAMLQEHGLTSPAAIRRWFPCGGAMLDWLQQQLATIRAGLSRPMASTRAKAAKPLLHESRMARSSARMTARDTRKTSTAAPTETSGNSSVAPIAGQADQVTFSASGTPAMAELPLLDVAFEVRFEMANADAIQAEAAMVDPQWFRLRAELTQLSLFEGFDELLCLPTLQGVEAHWYQIETVRKVLKQYRGRVLLADEVGLGKTVEAGMVLKEYALRGMAERILILTPASLVGQWQDEMEEKFGLDFVTSHDPLLRNDPERFWAQPRVIASIAAGRRKEHADVLGRLNYDIVVVDEAHHLRDQTSAGYRLVNGLRKRFLLLLSATPVQNSLLELYNLLTLLKPGVFKTQKEFRAAYMVPGKPREPANRDRLRELMRGVMVRNTRALAALRLPRRHASTLRAVPGAAEAGCYRDLTELAREVAARGQQRLAVQHLLSAAGSSPAAAAAVLARFIERHPEDSRWAELLERVRALSVGAKETALLRLLTQNPHEKKMVFVHHRDSMVHLAALLLREGLAFVQFDGTMSGPDKDAAVEAFRDHVPLLLCSESGGEGRNLQFCNTLINFDIPWNPMAIEQRIGRIDRIGQTREVFVFNLATSGTIEDAVLRILDEKINMFELVVGEVGAILGEMEEQQEFSTLVLDAWLEETETARVAAFAQLEGRLLSARQQYEGARELDDALFGNELDAA